MTNFYAIRIKDIEKKFTVISNMLLMLSFLTGNIPWAGRISLKFAYCRSRGVGHSVLAKSTIKRFPDYIVFNTMLYI